MLQIGLPRHKSSENIPNVAAHTTRNTIKSKQIKVKK